MSDKQFHTMPDGRRIAFRHTPGSGPTLVFLPGYMSDMEGGKATALFDWAQAQGRACLLLDYSGCGASVGDFADGTLTRWTQEVVALVEARAERNVVLIGSSMGGWLMLLAGLALGERLAGLVGIAAAPDFTEWGYSEADKHALSAGQTVYEDNPYGPDPTPMHAGFWTDGQAQHQLTGPIAIDVPARLLHGQCDADVPWQISMELAGALRSDAVQLTFIKDGDHRLSRPQDIALLLRTVGGLLDDLERQ
ncbi:alpha/beta fold hydrolase [Qipengyuania gaetbuli]|uniref:alpha/beta fold hydrolase n=1 Tax=Qipengyuania gaetbuli TaxID=266952 RepID=UPI001CD44C3A|nr:alpha/beta hydrolase [Qipengyuania gaetbuli]MCA0910034.1 alpha/beta hydrolase [Qipengyuania gaetbuli]